MRQNDKVWHHFLPMFHRFFQKLKRISVTAYMTNVPVIEKVAD